jgi:hypothetical protein
MKKILLISALFVSVAIARAEVFEINLNATNDPAGILSGLFEVPSVLTTATGGEVGEGIFFDNATRDLTINAAYGLFGFQPLIGSFTATHLHQSPAGTNGPVIIDLNSGATDIHFSSGPTSGFFSGTVNLTLPQIDSLFANNIYLNVHSSLFPGGEIRAQFIPATVPEPSTLAFVGFGLAAMALYRRSRA